MYSCTIVKTHVKPSLSFFSPPFGIAMPPARVRHLADLVQLCRGAAALVRETGEHDGEVEEEEEQYDGEGEIDDAEGEKDDFGEEVLVSVGQKEEGVENELAQVQAGVEHQVREQPHSAELLDGQPVRARLDEGLGPDKSKEDVGGDKDEVGEVE